MRRWTRRSGARSSRKSATSSGGGPSASLFWQDAAKKSGHSYFVWGGDARYAQLYWDKHNNLNPLTSGAGRFAIGEVFSATDIVPREQLVETPFYKEWMLPQGWGDVVCANLDKSITGRAVFVVARPAQDSLCRRRDAGGACACSCRMCGAR